jgi:hypothetical protein
MCVKSGETYLGIYCFRWMNDIPIMGIADGNARRCPLLTSADKVPVGILQPGLLGPERGECVGIPMSHGAFFRSKYLDIKPSRIICPKRVLPTAHIIVLPFMPCER